MTDLERVRPWLEGALEYSGGTHIWQDIVDNVVTGKMQLWFGEKSSAITEILCYPRKKVLHVFLAGGDMNELIDMIEDASNWGRTQGCNAITMSGRKGWQRVLDKDEWLLTSVTMGKEL
tara:strand:- start:732 stop:1088 length:357 start_codon:yes stop_codon:yes gene_type:complete